MIIIDYIPTYNFFKFRIVELLTLFEQNHRIYLLYYYQSIAKGNTKTKKN